MLQGETLQLVKEIAKEFSTVAKSTGLNYVGTAILDITEIIKEDLIKDIHKGYKVLTSPLGILFTTEDEFILFNEEKIKNLEAVNFIELLDVVGVPAVSFKYLNSTSLRLNRLYLPTQLGSIPGIIIKI